VTDPIVIELDGPPIAWARTRVNVGPRSKQFFTPKDQRGYATSLQWVGKEAMATRPLLSGPLSLSVVARLPIPASWTAKKKAAAVAGVVLPTSKPDYDNFAKLVGDALSCIVYCDDAQIVTARVSKIYSDKPGLRIEVAPMREAEGKSEGPRTCLRHAGHVAEDRR